MQTSVKELTSKPGIVFDVEGQSYQGYLFKSCEDPLFADVDGTSIFLSKAYHKALTSAPPEKMDFWFVRLEQGGQLIGMLCFQIKSFNPGDSLKKHASGSILKKIRYKAASLINLHVLCLGNTLVTGDYGFCFKDEIEEKMRTLLMLKTIDWLLTKSEFRHIQLIFVKDFYYDIFRGIPDSSYCQKYHLIDTQPSMILDIPTMWKGLNGYLGSLKSKYRVRAKKAIEMAKGIEKRELTLEEIEVMESQLHSLYLKVVDDVGFNLFILSVGYFTELKRQLRDHFHLWIYRKDDELIGFYTVFEDGDILDAHFLGYDPDVNHQYKLYMNMLLSMIDYAAANGFRQLQLSRTATEIKSSVGAEGVPMWAYMRAPNSLFNAWVPWLYSFFKPDLTWVRREPFHRETVRT